MMGYARLKVLLPKREAEALRIAMKPDDENPPKGFEIRSYVSGDELIYEAWFKYSDPSTLLTLLSIFDEVSRIAEMTHDMITRLNE